MIITMSIEDTQHTFQHLLAGLQSACESGDSDQMRVLDDQLRTAILSLANHDHPVQDKVELLREVGSIYQALSLNTAQARKDIADELMRMKREHKAATAYLNSSLKG